jgi:hypothetical protein
MVNEASRPIRPAYSRSRRAPMLWKVPAQGRLAAAWLDAPRMRCRTPAARHLVGGAAREGQQQDALRVGARLDQARDPVRQRIGLARPGAGHHQQRTHEVRAQVMLDRGALLGVELRERVDGSLAGGSGGGQSGGGGGGGHG